MGGAFMDRSEFERLFATEKQCREYIYNLRRADGYFCPKCGNNRVWLTSSGKCKCSNPSCRNMTALTAGTIFYNQKEPLRKWFRMMWLLSADANLSKLTTALLQRELKIGSNRTVLSMRNKLAPALVPPVHYSLARLSGTIELIVSKVFISNSEQYLVVAAERLGRKKTGRVRGSVLPSRTGNQINSFLDNCVVPDAVIVTRLYDYELQRDIIRHGYNVQSRDYYIYDLPYARHAESILRQHIDESLNREENCDKIDKCCAEHNSQFLPISFVEILEKAVTLRPDK